MSKVIHSKKEITPNEEDQKLLSSVQAYSIDGRYFYYEGPLSTSFDIGSFVIITADKDKKYFGQIINHDSSIINANNNRIHCISGFGILLGILNQQGLTATTNQDIFHKAQINVSDDQTINIYYSSINNEVLPLDLGRVLYVKGQSRFPLNPSGFNAHSLLCGQSGSGKTYALSIIIEQLLIKSNLKIIVLDLNSDYINLTSLHTLDEVNEKRTNKLSNEEFNSLVKTFSDTKPLIKIFRPRKLATETQKQLQIKFGDLSPHEQENILGFHPINDLDECHEFWFGIDCLVKKGDYSLEEIYKLLNKNFQRIIRRIDNLHLLNWDIWCSNNESSWLKELNDDFRCAIVDVGDLPSPQNLIIALSMLEFLWRNRNRKEPILIIIDEAHNICPQNALSSYSLLTTERIIQIANEGRKYGLYLFLSSQKPEKIHSHIISQCDNLILMRLNSIRDLNYLAEYFSRIPPTIIHQAINFNLGEAILAGNISRRAALIKFEGRMSLDGGANIPTSWVKPL
jgi:uncharacterized protein